MQQRTYQRGDGKETTWGMIIPLLMLLAMIGTEMFPDHKFDDELKPYYDQYLTIIHKSCKDEQVNLPHRTRIMFTESFISRPIDSAIGLRTIAICSRSSAIWDIRVLRSAWEKFTDAEKHEVMFHELSHCILWKDHVDNVFNYMYNTMSYVQKDVLIDQVSEDAWNYCQKK